MKISTTKINLDLVFTSQIELANYLVNTLLVPAPFGISSIKNIASNVFVVKTNSPDPKYITVTTKEIEVLV